MGETRVDLLHLLEDLRDAYTGSLEETILTELVANSLDSNATIITLFTDPSQASLTIVDDGAGMKGAQMTRYHDIASSAKIKGEGIGFAGVGVKLALLACEEVLTETRRSKSHVATTWHLASRHRAPWKRIPPPGYVVERGTAVRLKVKNPLSPLTDPGFAETVLQRHYAPLFDPAFAEILAPRYPRGVRFAINGRTLSQSATSEGRSFLAIRMPRRRKLEGWGVLVRDDGVSGEDSGLAISTLGKVIKRGWDWLGLSPGSVEGVRGMIEVPSLASCLALSKTDFIRSGARGALYLRFRKAVQEAVSAQLEAWGATRGSAEEQRRRVRPLERDLAKLLVDLADDFPLLASLVERRAGGQRRLPVGKAGESLPADRPIAGDGVGRPAEPDPVGALAAPPPPTPSLPEEHATVAEAPGSPPESAIPTKPGAGFASIPALIATRTSRLRRPAHYALRIELEARAEDPQIARLVDSVVRVNTAHPSYRRAEQSRSIGYHLAVSVALALAPLAIEPSRVHDFLTAFLARWGAAVEGPGTRVVERRKKDGGPTLR